jgi:hypothetical protein
LIAIPSGLVHARGAARGGSGDGAKEMELKSGIAPIYRPFNKG